MKGFGGKGIGLLRKAINNRKRGKEFLKGIEQ